jgi:hypothetical protein
MPSPPEPVVLFVVAAGPRLGFGHLVRSRVLADAMGVRLRACVRGTAASRRVARRMGWQLVKGWPSTNASGRVALVVVDDPSPRVNAQAVARARRHGIPVASVHDAGLVRVASDLSIDGGVARPAGVPPADLQGPR